MTDKLLSSTPALRIPRGAALALLSWSMFLVVLDGAMVNLAAATIRSSLALTATELAVVANSYLIAVAGLMLLGGRLADVLGGRRIFLLGMSVYVAASALAALAINAPMLILGRIGQGLGAAMAIPAALALVLLIYRTPPERTRAMGIWGAVAASGSLVGVFAGGMLTEALGWQSVFWTPVPLGLAAVLLVWLTIPPTPGRPGGFDLAGAVSISAGITALAVGAVNAAEIGWNTPVALLAVGAGGIAVGVFVTVERRTARPLVPLTVFRRLPVSTAAGVMMLVGGTLAGLFFFLPLYQQETLGMGALETGLTQVPLAVMLIGGSGLAPTVAKTVGLPRALSLSLGGLSAGLLWLAVNPATSFTWQHLGAFLVIGLGLGLALVSAMSMAVRDSGEGESGLLSGLVNASQSLGGALGLAVIAGLALTVGGGAMSYTTAFLGAAALTALAIVISTLGSLTVRKSSVPTH